MSDEGKGLFAAVVCLLIGFVIGSCVGGGYGADAVRRKAIEVLIRKHYGAPIDIVVFES